VVLLFALWNGEMRQLTHHMYYLSWRSSPYIRAMNQPNVETLAGKSRYLKVIQINRVESYWIKKFNGSWNSFGHTVVPRKLRNYDNKFTDAIYIRHFGINNITRIYWLYAPNRQLSTLFIRLSPRQLKLLSHCRICFGLWFMKGYSNHHATTVICSITKLAGATVCQHS